MAEYLIKDTTLTGIANAIRTKTGGTDPIVVSDMASQIEGITAGGGGSVEGVHYVTFMSEDGTTELYKRAVLDGNDCADPVSRGLIETPAQEGEYLKGWSASANGADDENILKAVTEDRVVYAVFASTFVDGGTFNSTFTWELDIYGELTVSGAGDMDLGWYGGSYAPWHNYRADIKSVTFNDGVTKVPKYACQNCTNLTSVYIPNSVTSIGQYAFSKCTALKDITIPNSVTSIDGNSFEYCPVTSVTIPGSVTSIAGSVFLNCTALTNATLMEGVKTLGSNAFSVCTSLTSVSLPNSLTAINGNAFSDCTSLTNVTIPGGVTNISTNVFLRCSALTSVIFDDTDTWYIGDSAGATTTQIDVTNPATNATNLVTTYVYPNAKYWTKK